MSVVRGNPFEWKYLLLFLPCVTFLERFGKWQNSTYLMLFCGGWVTWRLQFHESMIKRKRNILWWSWTNDITMPFSSANLHLLLSFIDICCKHTWLMWKTCGLSWSVTHNWQCFFGLLFRCLQFLAVIAHPCLDEFGKDVNIKVFPELDYTLVNFTHKSWKESTVTLSAKD